MLKVLRSRINGGIVFLFEDFVKFVFVWSHYFQNSDWFSNCEKLDLLLKKRISEPYSDANLTSETELFAKIVNFQQLTFIPKLSILDVCGIPGYASDLSLLTGICYKLAILWR